MDREKIETALAALDGRSDYAELGVVEYFHDPDLQMDDTGIVLTVADLRELLEAARYAPEWRDAESEKPLLGKDVEVEYGGIVRSGWLTRVDGWIIREDKHGPWVHGASVRRWRELPR